MRKPIQPLKLMNVQNNYDAPLSTSRKDSVSFYIPYICNFQNVPITQQVQQNDIQQLYKQLLDIQFVDFNEIFKKSEKRQIFIHTSIINFVTQKKQLIRFQINLSPNLQNSIGKKRHKTILKTKISFNKSILRNPDDIHQKILKQMQNSVIKAASQEQTEQNCYIQSVKHQSIGENNTLNQLNKHDLNPQQLIFKATNNVILKKKFNYQ